MGEMITAITERERYKRRPHARTDGHISLNYSLQANRTLQLSRLTHSFSLLSAGGNQSKEQVSLAHAGLNANSK